MKDGTPVKKSEIEAVCPESCPIHDIKCYECFSRYPEGETEHNVTYWFVQNVQDYEKYIYPLPDPVLLGQKEPKVELNFPRLSCCCHECYDNSKKAADGNNLNRCTDQDFRRNVKKECENGTILETKDYHSLC